MSLVFEDFEVFQQKLMEWRKRDDVSLDTALSTEIELETLLAELPVPPFEDWIDGIGLQSPEIEVPRHPRRRETIWNGSKKWPANSRLAA